MDADTKTAALPQDLRNMGYPVCDRAAAEIERLRAKLVWIADHSNDPAVVRECQV